MQTNDFLHPLSQNGGTVRELWLENQPTETSCGPTCLHGLYRYHGLVYDLNRLIREIPENEDGGTLSVHMGIHALKHGFRAITYSYNLRVFDPTWANLDEPALREKLRLRTRRIDTKKLHRNHEAYGLYLDLGGTVRFDELTPSLLCQSLAVEGPALVGLSATHLYRHTRQTPNGQDDDIAGKPEGHFVVLMDFDAEKNTVHIADPYSRNPFSGEGIYEVDVHRFINAVLLGIVTYDANLLFLRKA